MIVVLIVLRSNLGYQDEVWQAKTSERCKRGNKVSGSGIEVVILRFEPRSHDSWSWIVIGNKVLCSIG